MSDQVTVSNLALAKVGEPYRILDPNENTPPARTIKPLFDPCRKEVLRKGKFNFSMRRAELAAQAPTDPNYLLPYPYTNRFPIPAGFLRLVEVLDPPEARETYKFESGAILANSAGPLFILFVYDAPIGSFDELAADTLAAKIGFEIADVLTGDADRKARCLAEFRQRTKDAAGVDAKEDPPVAPYDSSWVTARCGGAIGGPPNV